MNEVVKRNEATNVEIRLADGVYFVVADEECLVSTAVFNSAEAEFLHAVEERSEISRRRLVSERSHFTMQAMRSESFARRAASARKTGGKGGRGGV